MCWKVDSMELAGSRHREAVLSCQDSTASLKKGSRQAIALVDAVGKTERSAQNSKTVANFVNEFLLNNFSKIQTSDKKNIAYNLMMQIERLLQKKSKEYQIPKKELASTFLGVVFDQKTQNYCMVHLGDGAIAAKGLDGKVFLLSEPYNGRTLRETPLTTSEDALKYVKVQKGCLKNIRGFLLVSDGVYQTNFDLKKLEEIFRKEKDHVILREKEDDQAYIRIVFSKSERNHTAENHDGKERRTEGKETEAEEG